MTGVLIGGSARSGTTLLAAMLGNSTTLKTLPESHFKTDLMWITKRFDRAKVCAALARHWQFQHYWHSTELDGVHGDSYREFFRSLFEHHSGDRLWVDHTPENILHAHTLLEMFDAKMIHVVRDGRAVACSLRRVDWGPNTTRSAALWWTQHIAAGLLAEQQYGAARILRVRYEQLVAEPKETLDEVTAFIGVPFEESMLESRGAPLSQTREQFHSQLVGKIDIRRTNAWQTELRSRQIEIFESLCGDALTLLGYTPLFGPRARPASLLEEMTSELGERLLRITNRIAFRRRHQAELKRC